MAKSKLRVWSIVGFVLAGASASAEVAEYRVTFDATWSATTHSTAYPPAAHFSNLVGGTHNPTVSFWSVGTLASNGIEQMAELGAFVPLLNEVNAEITAGDAFSSISGPAIFSPGSTSATFFIDDAFPLVTLVTMVAPSSDWFIGVSGLSLRPGGAWIDNLVVSLDPYDAGTDSGPDFESPDDDTQPAELISALGAPFTGTPPLATFTFERLPATCDDGLDNDGDTFSDFPGDPGCDSATDDSEQSPSLACDDGLDNDGDSERDFPDDPGCSSPSDADERELGLVCDDGLDNDADTFSDFPSDPGCADLTDPDEQSPGKVCDDGADNDGDMLIDYPEDPGCNGPNDATEELVVGVPSIGWAAWLGLVAALSATGVAGARRGRGALR